MDYVISGSNSLGISGNWQATLKMCVLKEGMSNEQKFICSDCMVKDHRYDTMGLTNYGTQKRPVYRKCDCDRVDGFPEERCYCATAQASYAAGNGIPERPRSEADSFVYYVRGGGFIKIGLAVNPQSRIAGIQTSCPFDLDLIGYEPGGRNLEVALHRRYRERHARGEWFIESPEMVGELKNRSARHRNDD